MKRTVVLLHGWGYRPSLWQGLAAELRHTHVLTPELRPTSPNIEILADELVKECPTDSIFVAWSLGAMLALCIAQRHPKHVSGMLLIGATPCFVAKTDWKHGLDPKVVAQFEADFTHSPQRTLRRFLALQLLGDQARNALSPLLDANLAKSDETSTILGTGLRMLLSADLRNKLPHSNVPCTLLHGEKDALMPLAAAQHLHQSLPGSRLIVRPDAGHAPLFTDTALLAKLVLEVRDGCC